MSTGLRPKNMPLCETGTTTVERSSAMHQTFELDCRLTGLVYYGCVGRESIIDLWGTTLGIHTLGLVLGEFNTVLPTQQEVKLMAMFCNKGPTILDPKKPWWPPPPPGDDDIFM